MAHFAHVINGNVMQVIVAEPDFIEEYKKVTGGDWIQTSYNTKENKHPEGQPLRGNYAGVGYIYDKENDVFYAPQPFKSWTLNKNTWTWQAPTPKPDDGKIYSWDEPSLSWKEIK